MSEDFEREPVVAQGDYVFEPSVISPSRVNKLTECGVAFKMQYIDRIPKERNGSFALFGSVVHKALENWSTDREQNLLDLMRAAWISETEEGPVVREFLERYQEICVEVIKAEHAAREAYNTNPRNKGKACQAPRMTKHFKESDAARKLNRLLAEWMPKLTADSPWEFTERDPLPQFYDDSLVLAKRYARQWGHLAPALYTEREFSEPWRGFTLKGYIDSVELLLSPAGELQGVGIVDYKTYKREPAEHKDYRQLVIYDAAVRSLVERGVLDLPDVPIYVGIDYVRYAGVEVEWLKPAGNSRRFWRITDADHDRVERELNAYKAMVEGGCFLPAPKSANPDFCDYGSLCCLRSTSHAGGSAEAVELAL